MSYKIHSWEEEVVEGRAKIIIPKMELFKREDNIYEPAWSPVFYNPLMRLSRDLSILVTQEFFHDKEFFYIDVLGGTGVRGIRLSLETPGLGIVNDVDPIAYYYIVRNIKHNRVVEKVKPYMCEANALLNNYTFSGIPVHYIDVDPYGSPIPYIDSSVKPLAKQALYGVTATDSGPLTCSHRYKTLRRYNVRCTDVDFNKELGLRILIYNIVFRASSQDVALKPLLSYSYKYYYRVFFQTIRSGRESYKIIDECRGYIWYCRETMERTYLKEYEEVLDHPCTRDAVIIGPLWICKLGEQVFIHKLLERGKSNKYISNETLELLNILKKEVLFNKPYIRYDLLFGKYRRNMPSIKYLIKRLKESGFRATHTHFDPRGIKTDAEIEDIVEIFINS